MTSFAPRAWCWMGPLLGAGGAALWGGPTPGWLLTGALLGLAAEYAAARIAAAERTRGERTIAFFLVSLTLLALIPFLAIVGVLPAARAGLGAARAGELLLVPVAALLLTGWRHARAAPEAAPAAGRAAPRADAARWLWIFGALLLVLGLGYADYRLPAPFSLDFLYLLPVFAVTWATGRWGGVVLALFSAEVHGIVLGLAYPGALAPGLSVLDSLLIAVGLAAEAVLLAALKTGLEREKLNARTDPLTGLQSRTAFLERLELETSRADRYGRPLSMAYLDLDGFKRVNDTHGHAAGDEVLRIVAGVLRTSLRGQDVPARLGGDEFAVLLPETDADSAVRVMERLRREVEERMAAWEWPVTCSVGVVTSLHAGTSGDELIRRADALMYEVKHEGKNALRQAAV